MSNSKKTFLWAVGHSCSGKDTFLGKIQSDPLKWSELLSVNLKRIVRLPISPSIERIEAEFAKGSSFLLQWQHVGKQTVNDLKSKYPNDFHIVVYILRERFEHQEVFKAEYPQSSFDWQAKENAQQCEVYLNVVDRFVYVVNIQGNFHVVGWRG